MEDDATARRAGGHTRRWIGFVPESALEEFREVLKQHDLEPEES